MGPRSAAVGALLALLALGCPSAYDRAYEAESRRLEAEDQARQAEREAAVEEARRYAAVVYFEVGSAVIKEQGYHELDWFVERIRGAPEALVQVQGFADSTGDDALNQELSEERARSVARYLTSVGVAPSRIVVQGFSSEFAAEPNESTKGRRSNRRVEVTVR